MSDDSPEEIFERLQEIVQETILRAYPNPERRGCCGPELLSELAKRPWPKGDLTWDHVSQCSPCYREFLDFRAQVKQEGEVSRRRALRLRVSIAAGVTLLLAGAIGAYEILRHGD